MNSTELIDKAQFVTDGSGNRTAVLLDYAAWEELLTLIEDMEDAEEISRSRAAGEDPIPWEQAKADLRAHGEPLRPIGLCAGEFTVPDDFNKPLPDHILKEFKGKI